LIARDTRVEHVSLPKSPQGTRHQHSSRPSERKAWHSLTYYQKPLTTEHLFLLLYPFPFPFIAFVLLLVQRVRFLSRETASLPRGQHITILGKEAKLTPKSEPARSITAVANPSSFRRSGGPVHLRPSFKIDRKTRCECQRLWASGLYLAPRLIVQAALAYVHGSRKFRTSKILCPWKYNI